MPDTQLPLPIARPHNNQQLFSDYYLNELLPRRPGWDLLLAEAQAALASMGDIYRAYTPSTNEAQTENDLIRPILKRLGHDFEVQPTLKTPDGTKRPDYVLYRDTATLNANKGRTLDDRLPQQGGLAVGDAKYWDWPLDTTLRGSGDPAGPQFRARPVASRRLPRPLTSEETSLRERLEAQSPLLHTAATLTTAFAGLIRHRTDHAQASRVSWVADATAASIPALASFARGLRDDWSAMVAGLTLKWSNGPVEGAINRLKLIKRQMFGRANFDLLRRRVMSP